MYYYVNKISYIHPFKYTASRDPYIFLDDVWKQVTINVRNAICDHLK